MLQSRKKTVFEFPFKNISNLHEKKVDVAQHKEFWELILVLGLQITNL